MQENKGFFFVNTIKFYESELRTLTLVQVELGYL